MTDSNEQPEPLGFVVLELPSKRLYTGLDDARWEQALQARKALADGQVKTFVVCEVTEVPDTEVVPGPALLCLDGPDRPGRHRTRKGDRMRKRIILAVRMPSVMCAPELQVAGGSHV